VEKLGPDHLLQLAELLAERRLGHVEPHGGPAEMQFFRDDRERVEQAHGKQWHFFPDVWNGP